MKAISGPLHAAPTARPVPAGSDLAARAALDDRAAALQDRIRELEAEFDQLDWGAMGLPTTSVHSTRTATAQPPTVALSGLPGQEDSADGRSNRVQQLLRSLPGWATSAGLHTVLVVVLALLTYGGQTLPSIVILAEPVARAELPEQAEPLFIRPAEIALEDFSRFNELDMTPVDFGTPPVIEAPEIPLGLAATSIPLESAGAILAVDKREPKTQARAQAGAQFFGVQATGNDFVFIVDSSMSMTQKFADAKRELEYSVRQLSPQQRFYVIFFDRNAERMVLGKFDKQRKLFVFNDAPEPDLVPATTQNIDAFVQWMNTIQLEFATNPYMATFFAINELKPDAIFLLSDGEFTDRGATEWFLLESNAVADVAGKRQPRSVVHCIGFYSREGEITLKRIAAANGGTYRFVQPPPDYVPMFRTPRGGMRRGPR